MSARVPNMWVGPKIGYSESGISRVRSGDREPTLGRMREIERVFGWDVCEQTALTPAEWVEKFEEVLEEAYDKASKENQE